MDEKHKAAQYISNLDDYLRPYMQLMRNSPFDEILDTAAVIELTRPKSSAPSGKANDKKRKAPDGTQKRHFLTNNQIAGGGNGILIMEGYLYGNMNTNKTSLDNRVNCSNNQIGNLLMCMPSMQLR